MGNSFDGTVLEPNSVTKSLPAGKSGAMPNGPSATPPGPSPTATFWKVLSVVLMTVILSETRLVTKVVCKVASTDHGSTASGSWTFLNVAVSTAPVSIVARIRKLPGCSQKVVPGNCTSENFVHVLPLLTVKNDSEPAGLDLPGMS